MEVALLEPGSGALGWKVELWRGPGGRDCAAGARQVEEKEAWGVGGGAADLASFILHPSFLKIWVKYM